MRVGDTDLTNPGHVEGVLKARVYIMDLSEDYPDLLDLRIEMEDWVKIAGLTELSTGVVVGIVRDHTQKKAAEELGVSVKALSDIKETAMRKISETEGPAKKKPRTRFLSALFGALLGK